MTTYTWVALSLLLVTVPVTALGQTSPPPNPPAAFVTYKSLGDAARDAGDVQKALEHYQKALALYDDAEVAGEAGLLLFAAGEFDVAAHQLARAVNDGGAGLSKDQRLKYSSKFSDVLLEVCLVHIFIDQPKAEVLIDDRLRSKERTDFVVYLKPGEHIVRARLVGFEDAQQKLVTDRACKQNVSLVMHTPTPSSSTQDSRESSTPKESLYVAKLPPNPLKSSTTSRFVLGAGLWNPFFVAPGFTLGLQFQGAWLARPWLALGAELRGGFSLGNNQFKAFDAYTLAMLWGACARKEEPLAHGHFLACLQGQFDGGSMHSTTVTWSALGANLRFGYEVRLAKRFYLGIVAELALHNKMPNYTAQTNIFWRGSKAAPEFGLTVVRFF